jgi:hypothetical protein
MAFVTIRIKGAEGYTRISLGKDRMVLGRSSESGLPVKHTSISREHCVFIREGDDWLVEDLGSANGTWVNKDKLTGKVRLEERDIVKAGKARLTFHRGEMGEADAAIDLASDDDLDLDGGEGEGDGPATARTDVAEAMTCKDCGAWMSIVHRSRGEKMACPRCGHDNLVVAH